MWRIVIYDRSKIDQPAIAICELQYRGEYEMLNHLFDDTRFRYKTISLTELETYGIFGIELPVKNINDYCRHPRD